jgi:hypothetical protein
MKRFIYTFLFAGFLHLAYGLSVSFWRPSVWPELVAVRPSKNFYDYAGALNVRTLNSSGTGTYDEVIRSAQESKLSFIIFTDFNDFSPDRSYEAYHDNLLVFVGGEYSYLNSRVMNFDTKSTDHLQGPGRSQVAIADLLSQHNPSRAEGVFVLSHPLKPGYQMAEPYLTGLNGIEVINLKSVWQDAWLDSKLSFVWSIFMYPFNSNLAFLRILADAGEREITILDKLNKKNPTHGYFGSAAEARFKIAGALYVPFPSYSTLFSIVSNHVLLRSELTGNAQQDRKKISDALRRGQFYMSLDMLQDPKGFEAFLIDSKQNIGPIGSVTPAQPGQELVVSLPAKPQLPFQIIIYKDGEKVLTSTSMETRYTLHGPGVYRAIVRLKIPLPIPDGRKWINWIVTNPFYIRS